jgi:quinohemoprotein ethanol dehydrogenase
MAFRSQKHFDVNMGEQQTRISLLGREAIGAEEMKVSTLSATFLVIIVTLLVHCADSAAANLMGQNWPGVGGQSGEQHYSSLDRINAKTVGTLGLAWSLDLDGEHTLEATPVEIDGTLYFSGQNSAVYAVNSVTGRLLWKFDPERFKYRPWHLRLVFPVNRGVAVANGKVFVGTLDGRLIAVDAHDGHTVWSVKTVGDDSSQAITGAPRVFKDMVVIGNSGGDAGARAYVTAYYIDTGKQAWRFYIVPGNPVDGFEQPAMKMAAATWSGEWWKTGTGGSAWDNMVYDPELNRLYIGTGNSGPYNPRVRNPGGGDNLFLTSIVAVDADTGRYIWHYQMNPNEAWDFKATANIILADITIDKTRRKVLMQSPTNGFFYVIDRDTGKLISAEKTGKVTWADHIDLKTGRPAEEKNIRYESGPVTFWPSPYGTHNWQPMAYSPATGLTYIPAMQLGARWESDEAFEKNPRPNTLKSPYVTGAILQFVKADENDGAGSLIAWDPVTQTMRWQVRYPHMWNGGTLATSGNLVFQGDGEGQFHAYNATNGKELWKFDAKLGIIGAPITYSVSGVQYVSLLVGYGGATGYGSDFASKGWKYNRQPRRLLTFALNATADLPVTMPRDYSVAALDDAKLVLDEKAVVAGAKVYGNGCAMCHGLGASSIGVPGPDLREASIVLDLDGFSQLLRSGALATNGMPKYDDYSQEEIRELYMYIRAAARVALGKYSFPSAIAVSGAPGG